MCRSSSSPDLTQGMVPPKYAGLSRLGVPPVAVAANDDKTDAFQPSGTGMSPLGSAGDVTRLTISPSLEAELRQNGVQLLVRLGPFFLGLLQQDDGLLQRHHVLLAS